MERMLEERSREIILPPVDQGATESQTAPVTNASMYAPRGRGPETPTGAARSVTVGPGPRISKRERFSAIERFTPSATIELSRSGGSGTAHGGPSSSAPSPH